MDSTYCHHRSIGLVYNVTGANIAVLCNCISMKLEFIHRMFKLHKSTDFDMVIL